MSTDYQTWEEQVDEAVNALDKGEMPDPLIMGAALLYDSNKDMYTRDGVNDLEKTQEELKQEGD